MGVTCIVEQEDEDCCQEYFHTTIIRL